MKKIIFLFSFLAIAISNLSAQFETETESYVGNIDKYKIFMDLEFTPDGQGGVFYTGTYYYESQGEDKRIKLDGASGDGGSVVLYERDAKGNISATFELTSPKYGALDGSWTSAKGKVFAVYMEYPDLPNYEDNDEGGEEDADE